MVFFSKMETNLLNLIFHLNKMCSPTLSLNDTEKRFFCIFLMFSTVVLSIKMGFHFFHKTFLIHICMILTLFFHLPHSHPVTEDRTTHLQDIRSQSEHWKAHLAMKACRNTVLLKIEIKVLL